MTQEAGYIIRITQIIEESLAWRSSEYWADYDYKKLSDLIFEKTNVIISPLTLKRIYKNSKEGIYNPKLGTKDALARFVGYTDWQQFISSVALPREEEQIPTQPVVGNELEVNQSPLQQAVPFYPEGNEVVKLRKPITPFMWLLMVLGITGIYFIFFYHPHKMLPLSSPAVLYADSSIGNAPLTVSFYYDVAHLPQDTFYISVSGDKNKKQIKKSRHHFNKCFELPGIYTISIFTGNKVVATTQVTVRSEVWYANYFPKKNQFITEKDFKTALDTFLIDTVSDGFLYFPYEQLKQHGVNTSQPFFISNYYYDSIYDKGDSCKVKIRFRNSLSDGGIACQGFQLNLFGDSATIHIGLTNPKCFSFINLNIAGKVFTGDVDNLKKLGINMNTWNVLSLQIRKPNVVIVLNKNILFKCKYNKSIGKIRGFQLTSQGSARYDFVRLFDQHDSLVFREEFDSTMMRQLSSMDDW